jgi:hypothetical protein
VSLTEPPYTEPLLCVSITYVCPLLACPRGARWLAHVRARAPRSSTPRYPQITTHTGNEPQHEGRVDASLTACRRQRPRGAARAFSVRSRAPPGTSLFAAYSPTTRARARAPKPPLRPLPVAPLEPSSATRPIRLRDRYGSPIGVFLSYLRPFIDFVPATGLKECAVTRVHSALGSNKP